MPLAGCIGGSNTSDTLTRSIKFDLDQSTLRSVETPADVVHLAVTTFTFSPGGSFQVEGAIVAFTNLDGNAVEKPLADFTRRASLSAGDSVTITGAAFYSGIAIMQNGKTVVDRPARTADWLMADHAPLPLAATEGAKVGYDFSAKGTIGLAVDRFAAGGSEGGSFTNLQLDGSMTESGTLSLDAAQDGPALKVSLDADLTGHAEFAVSADVKSSEGNGPAGVKFNGDAHLNGQLAARFVDHELTEGGFGGSADGDFTLKMQAPGQSSYTEMPGARHPALSENEPFAWHAVPSSAAAPAEVVQFLTNLYGMTLAPGDSFSMKASQNDGSYGFDFTYTLNAAGRQDRTVGGHTFHALKMLGTTGFAMHGSGQEQTVRSFTFTYWIDSDSLLPIEMSWDAAETLSRTDLAGALEALSKAVPDVTLPDSMTLEATSSSTVKISNYAPGFQSTVAGGAFGFAFPLAAMGAGAFR